MLKKVKSIRTKLIVTILPVAILAFVALAVIVTVSARQVTTNEVNKKMEAQTSYLMAEIDRHLAAHEKMPVALAKMAEAVPITLDTEESYKDLIMSVVATNKDTVANGIFLKDKVNGSYFCPYAYMEGGKAVYSEELYQDNTGEEWYQSAAASDLVAWSMPYFEAAISATMVTAGAPIRDSSGNVIGVATGDMGFDAIGDFVSKMQVGQNGYAMLLAGDGSYLCKGKEEIQPDANGVFPNVTGDANQSLAKLGAEILANKNGIGVFEDENGMETVYYAQLERTGWIVLLTLPQSEIEEPIAAIISNVILITAITLLLLIIMIVFISNSITKPLKPLQKHIEAVAKGDFTSELKSHSSDEIGRIATGVNTMAAELRETLQEILKSSELVAGTAEELEASSSQNSLVVEQVATSASEISETNTSVERETQAVEETIRNIRSLAGSITGQMETVVHSLHSANQESDGGEHSVQQLIQAMGQVSGAANELSSVMGQLMDKSEQIKQIVVTMHEISDQTNLLALNASIEAARAGEAGKGFAVVAEEIRKLAEQSSHSAESISAIVGEVSSESSNANSSTSTVVSSIQSSQQALNDVGEAFHKIADSIVKMDQLVREADQLSKEIDTISDNAKLSAEHLTSLIDASAEQSVSIAAATEEQLASMEEQTSATSSLAQIAEELKAKVGMFRL